MSRQRAEPMDPFDIEPGYYAVPDTDDPEKVTCWKRANGKKKTFGPWPAAARYIARPKTREEIPEYHRAFGALLAHVVAEIQADPDGCRQRFARVRVRCHACGRELTDETSRDLGIGPECRKGAAA